MLPGLLAPPGTKPPLGMSKGSPILTLRLPAELLGLVAPIETGAGPAPALAFHHHGERRGLGSPFVDKKEERPMNLHWKPHPIAELFPGMTPEEKADIKKDMRQRAENGLDPLEHPILLYEEMILDGRHRDHAWIELAEEDACNGFFKRNLPPTENFSPDKHGNLTAFLRAKSLNMVHRHIPADQKVAILLDAAEKYPEIKTALDAIKHENLKRQKEGKPLDAGDQRGNTAEQIGQLAGVGPTTVKGVRRLKEKAPDQFKEVVQGKKTVKKALKEQAGKEQKAKTKQPRPGHKPRPVGNGDYPKGERPKIAQLVRIVHRGLAAEEAEGLSQKGNAVFFQLNGYRVKVTCEFV
jgi:hypothetical protein